MLFNKFGLKGTFSLGHLDPKHMLIRLEHEGGFNHLWMKDLIFIERFSLRIFMWTPDSSSDVVSSIVPVWMSLPNHHLFCFD